MSGARKLGRARRSRSPDRAWTWRVGPLRGPCARVALKRYSRMDRRLLRETSFGLAGKLWQINWLYVLLLCALAGVGYTALYSAAGGSPEPYADRHVMRFAAGLVLMLGVALVDIRVIAEAGLAGLCRVPGAAAGGGALSAMSARARSAGSSSAGCSCSRRR